jgi:RND family efflux transporter MFP subunit
MILQRGFVVILSLSLLLCSAGCKPHSHDVVEEKHEHDPTSVTVFGERLLVFMEFPHIVCGTQTRFLVHLSVLATGEPVRAGNVVLDIGGTQISVNAPKRDGLFIAEGAFPKAGTLRGSLTVTSPQADEKLDLGELAVHGSAADADHAAHDAGGDEPAGAVPFLMEQQWKVKLLLAEAGPRTLKKHLTVPARAVAPEGAVAVVSSAVSGRLVASPSTQFPRTGDRVEAGQALGWVEPPLAAADIAQFHALELEFASKSLDLLQAAEEARTRRQFAARERERIGKLRAEGLSTQQQLERAEQDLALAEAAVDSNTRMQAALNGLIAARSSTLSATSSAPIRFPLTAPISGTIAQVSAVPGQSVNDGEPLFRILDSARVWIEGRMSEYDLSAINTGLGAVGTFAALPDRRFELRGGKDGKPFIAQEVDIASHTLLVRYEIENPDGAIRPGMLAEMAIATVEHAAPVTIPTEALVMDQGMPTVYVMLEGELFQKRDLELGVKDGHAVEILRGLKAGERVATRGAQLVKLAALSPAAFGHGHAH